MNPQKIFDAIDADFGSLFDKMAIAEEQIKAWESKYPQRAPQIHDAFQHMYPRPTLYTGLDAPDHLYKWHVQEILEAIGTGCPVPQVTRAEALAAFSACMTKAPLTQDASAATLRLFLDCQTLAGENIITDLTEAQIFESYAGAVDELIAYTYRKIKQIQ